MSLEQAKKDQPEAAQAQTNQDAPAPIKLITKPIADPHYVQSPKTEIRKLTLPVPADETEKDLFLVVLDKDQVIDGKKDEHDNNYQIYLGRSKSFKRGEGPDYFNTLVPLVPRCYATPDRDPAQAVEVPEGWLYIIRQFTNPRTGSSEPELWRELKSDGLGNFRDVNLKRFEGKDQRRATGQSGLRIIVPYCIDKQAHDLWIAYSEVQWSWTRVQSILEKHELRNRRMHKLDLSDCLNNFANSGYTAPQEQQSDGKENKPEAKNVSLTTAPGNLKSATDTYSQDLAEDQKEKPPVFNLGEVVVEGTGNAAELYNLKSAPDPESRNLAADFKEAIPVVYLDNPIGIGRRLAGEYQQQWQELSDCVKTLRAIPDYLKPKHEQPEHIRNSDSIDPEIQRIMAGPERYFEAAALANRYFYCKISKVIPPGVKDIPAYEKRLAEIDEQFLKYQNNLDKTAIEQALRTSQRRAIREKLVQARDKLVNFLEKELATIKSKDTEGETQDPPLVLALDDYFTLTPLGDRERKQNPDDAVGDKSTPRWRDNYLDGWGAVYDLVALLGKHEYSIDADLEANPKDGWDWRCKNPAFVLLLNLADPEGGYPLHSRLFPKPTAGKSLKIDAAKVEDTATEFKIQHLDNLELLIQRDADIARGLNLFGSNLNELMSMRHDKDPAYEKRLERACHSILRLIESASPIEFEMADISLAELIAQAEKELEEDNSGGAPLFQIFEKSMYFSYKSIDAAKDFPESAEPSDGPLGQIRVKVVTVVNKNRAVQLLRRLGDKKAVTSGLAGFLGVVKFYNFSQALKAYTGNRNDDRDWELFAPLVSSILKLPDAIKNIRGMVDAMAGREAASCATKAAEGALDLTTTRATTKATGVEVLGKFAAKALVVAYLIDFDLTLSSFLENLAQNDDAAIADLIGLSGITVAILATFVSIPGAGWIIGLTALAALLAKAFLFKEDTPVDIWINNGPFARGEEYHDAFYYNRSTTIKKVRDDKGNWVNTACTVHRYDNFEFLVDNAGILVHAGPSQFHSPIQRCRVAPDGTVYLKAGKWYDIRSNKWHEIPANTTVATVGQPFTMHQLLEPTQKTTPQALTVKQPTTGVENPYKMRKLPPSLLLNTAQSYGKKDMSFWPHSHDAYLALADAIYRPRVTLTGTHTFADSKCVLAIKLPFYLPGKSQMFIEFGEKDQNLSKFDPGSIKNLKVGPGEYEIVEQFPYFETKSFTAKVRLDLFGEGEIQLPHDPLFCGAEIETQIDDNTNKGTQFPSETKWIVAEKKVFRKINTHSKLEAYVDVLIDNIKDVF